MRIGIGPRPAGDTVTFVLDKIGRNAERIVAESLEDAADATELILRGEHQVAQERFNKKSPQDDGDNREKTDDLDSPKVMTGTVQCSADASVQSAEGDEGEPC